MAALKLENIASGYGGLDIIKNISFSLEYGQNLSILGPSGCGKTTLLKTMVGIINQSRGNIFIDDKNINNIKRFEIAKRISMLSQLSNTYFSFSIFDTVMLGRYIHMKGVFSKPSKIDIDIVENCLKAVHLLDIKDKEINTLSGGQLQRVFLARTFAQEPSIILLDEPTNHLDIGNQISLLDYMHEWASIGNRCIVGVLHDINLSLRLSDKVLLLKDGDILFYGDSLSMDKELFNILYDMNVVKFMNASLREWNTK